jgi:hypothetical protein
MRARINELLTLARLPSALWTSIHPDSREHYDNPGSSVMSFCARYLACEYMEIPEVLHESIVQCRDFSTKREHLQVVLEFLELSAAVRAAAVNELPELQQKMIFYELSEVVKLNQEVTRLVQSFEVNGLIPTRIDASSQIYPTFVQALVEMSWSLDRLSLKLDSLMNTSSKA